MSIRSLAFILPVALVFIVVSQSFAVGDSQGENQLTEKAPMMKETFVVSTIRATPETIAIVDPSFKVISGTSFLVGKVSDRQGYVQATPFSNGLSFIATDKIVSIQELTE